MRKRVMFAVLALIAMAAAAGCSEDGASSAGGSKEGPSEIRFTTAQCVCYLPAEVALKQGFVKEKMDPLGAKLDVGQFEDGPSQTAAVLSGSLDIARYGINAFAGLLARNAPVTAIAISDESLTTEGLVVKNDSGIASAADLKGKTIGTAVGSTSEMALRFAMSEAGLTTKDVKIINVAPGAVLAAWNRGDIDGAYYFDPFLSQMAAADGKVIVTDADLTEQSGGKFRILDVYAVRNDFAKKYPEAVKAYLEAVDQGVAYTAENTQEVADGYFKDMGAQDSAELVKQIKGSFFLIAADSAKYMTEGGELAQALQNAWQFAFDSGTVTVKPSMDVINEHIDASYLSTER